MCIRDRITAIVGPSGSGKSTIAKLMAGFWDATGGTVSFGGQDIQNIPFDQLMGEISYVAQDNFLFDRSIRENIRMGDPSATDAEVEAAARAANCHDFIMNLEQGYDTLAGDAGEDVYKRQALFPRNTALARKDGYLSGNGMMRMQSNGTAAPACMSMCFADTVCRSWHPFSAKVMM